MTIPMNFDISSHKEHRFEKWLRRVVGQDSRYKHLLVDEYKDERTDFYNYFSIGMSPWQALQEEYKQYGP